jgi:hypothetical protein
MVTSRIALERNGHAMAAHRRFSENSPKVLGTILNDWNPKHSAGGYHGYYNGYHSGHCGRHGYYGSSSRNCSTLESSNS